jgi:hypothetical protein
LLNERYFLIIQNLDIDLYEHAFFCSAITEFAKFINNSKPLMSKILENAELIKPR